MATKTEYIDNIKCNNENPEHKDNTDCNDNSEKMDNTAWIVIICGLLFLIIIAFVSRLIYLYH